MPVFSPGKTGWLAGREDSSKVGGEYSTKVFVRKV